MTEPDEALIWAREQPASLALPVIRMAHAYRAGQAASAERIKALEEALRGLEPHLDAIICYASTMDEHEPNRLAFAVRALLKEADQ